MKAPVTSDNDFWVGLRWGKNRRKTVFFAVAMAVTLLIIYANSFDCGWHLDDRLILDRNKNLQLNTLSWKGIVKTFYSPHALGAGNGNSPERISRPAVSLTLALNYYFGQTNVVGYHIVNLIIHYISAIYLFLFVFHTLNLPGLRKGRQPSAYTVAMLAVFFWATHPVHVSAVTYIVQRMTSMAGMGFIMAMYYYLKGRTSPEKRKQIFCYAGCVLAWGVALGSKENAAMLPVCLVLYDLLVIQDIDRTYVKKHFKALLAAAAIVILIGIIFVLGMYSGFSMMLKDYDDYSFTLAERLLTAPKVLLLYLSLLIYPILSRLTLFYDIETSVSLWEPYQTLLPVLGVILLLGAALWLIIRKQGLYAFCILFFFSNHLIEGTVIPLHLSFLHRNYIPAMLIFLAPAFLMVRVLDYFAYNRGIQGTMAVGIGLLLAIQGSVTFSFNRVWKTEQTLWQDNIEKFPNLSLPHNNLGGALYRAGDYERAQAELQKALDLNRNQVRDHVSLYRLNLAKALLIQNKEIDIAIAYLERVIQAWPLKADAHDVMGLALMRKGDYRKAAVYSQQAIQLNPGAAEYYLHFGLGLFKRGDLEEAYKFARVALALDRNSLKPLAILAEIFSKKDRPQRAIFLWERFHAAYPQSLDGILALIDLYHATGRYRKAAQKVALLFQNKGSRTLRELVDAYNQEKNVQVYTPDLDKLSKIIGRLVLQTVSVEPEEPG